MLLYEDIPQEERIRLLDKLANEIIRWHMGIPAIIFLESSKYLNRIGSQFLIFLSPVVTAVFTSWELEKYAVIIEERSNIDYLLDTIEAAEKEQEQKEREERLKRKEERAKRKSERKNRRLWNIFGKKKGKE